MEVAVTRCREKRKVNIVSCVIASANVSRVSVKVYNIFTVFILLESKCMLAEMKCSQGVCIAVKHMLTTMYTMYHRRAWREFPVRQQ